MNQHLRLLARTADSIADGDHVEKTIRSRQNWSLLPMQVKTWQSSRACIFNFPSEKLLNSVQFSVTLTSPVKQQWAYGPTLLSWSMNLRFLNLIHFILEFKCFYEQAWAVCRLILHVAIVLDHKSTAKTSRLITVSF